MTESLHLLQYLAVPRDGIIRRSLSTVVISVCLLLWLVLRGNIESGMPQRTADDDALQQLREPKSRDNTSSARDAALLSLSESSSA